MKHITLKIHDRDYEIISRLACAEGKTVEGIAWEGIKEHCLCDLSCTTGLIMGLGQGPDYDDAFADEVFEATFGGGS